MSSGAPVGGQPDTSIVAICQGKIQQALDTSNVKVTGAVSVGMLIRT